MTTVHAYTGDQKIRRDALHKDLRRARAAALSMIPTSTGAAKAVGLLWPALKGKLDGAAIRAPTANVSLIDFKFDAARDTSREEVNALMEKAAELEKLRCTRHQQGADGLGSTSITTRTAQRSM